MVEGDRRQEISQSEEESAGEGEFPRTETRQENAAQGRRQAQAANGQAERPTDLGIRPAVGVGERLDEVAPGVYCAQAKLQERAREDDEPAVHGDDSLCGGGKGKNSQHTRPARRSGRTKRVFGIGSRVTLSSNPGASGTLPLIPNPQSPIPLLSPRRVQPPLQQHADDGAGERSGHADARPEQPAADLADRLEDHDFHAQVGDSLAQFLAGFGDVLLNFSHAIGERRPAVAAEHEGAARFAGRQALGHGAVELAELFHQFVDPLVQTGDFGRGHGKARWAGAQYGLPGSVPISL